MEIVSSMYVLNFFRKIKDFEMDLGTNLKGPANLKRNGEEPKIKIRDLFVKQYQTVNNRIITKFGNIGSLKFYEDLTMKNDELHIYHEDQIFEIEIDRINIATDSEKYLVDIIKYVKGENVENDDVKDVIYTNMPENIERPDMTLPLEQYVEQLVKRRDILNRS